MECLAPSGLADEARAADGDKKWVVHSNAVGDGRQALRYLAPYVYRVAISNGRLVKCEPGPDGLGRVTFTYRKSGSVEEGSRVQQGQVLARLENEDALASRDQAEANLRVSRANLEEAKAQLEESTKTFDRYKQLVAGGYIARADYDTAEARYLRAQAAVAAAEASIKASAAALQSTNVALEYALIRAPFDAVVLTKNADIGDIVTPLGAGANAKASVVTIADLKSLQVEADVSETNLGLVKGGQPCEIQLDALPNSRFRGASPRRSSSSE